MDRPPAQGKNKAYQVGILYAFRSDARGGVLLHDAQMQSSHATADLPSTAQAAWDRQRHGGCTCMRQINGCNTLHAFQTMPKQEKQARCMLLRCPNPTPALPFQNARIYLQKGCQPYTGLIRAMSRPDAGIVVQLGCLPSPCSGLTIS